MPPDYSGHTLCTMMMAMATSHLPVVCTLTPETIATRKAELLPGLARRAISRDGTDDGIRLVFASDALSAIAAVIEAERRCCRFLQFEISVAPDDGPVTLMLSGPRGTREFLEALIDA